MSGRRFPLRLLGLLAVLASLILAGAAEAATGDPESWKNPVPERPAILLVQGGTVWTSGPEGVLEDADVLVRDGRIAAVGQGLSAPAGAVVVDARGKHVTPGIFDAHSHIAIDGGVNEATNIVTAEVRIEDVIDPDDLNIYRQLAGGVTAAHLLHGSANAIGGHNAVIKLRWGADAQGLIFQAAPPGIKFALGENPKGSNQRDPSNRYPRTRLGVERVLRQAFTEARDYRRRWQEYEADGGAGSGRVPPRRDFQMEALVEILEGERLVHAHSYRGDEILMLLRLAEDFGFRIATFQHVLEGYKVADELAAHGAGASTFSDWWAFKYEVRDAIPYNGTLMTQRGVLTSFNSDSGELARRLNLEAAKAVRYGGLDPEEALKLVTLNAAIQLGVGDRVGSLEPGKDADLVIWSGAPLSTFSRAEQTWVDGRKYFDREEDLQRRTELAAERQALMAKVRALEAAASSDDETADEEALPVEPELPESEVEVEDPAGKAPPPSTEDPP